MRREAFMTYWIQAIVSVALLWGGLWDSADAQFSPPPNLPTVSVPRRISEPLATVGSPEQSAASIQALVMEESGVIYAGSFGHGIFRTEDRGVTWLPVGRGVTDPFVLSLASAKDGAIYAGTFRGGVFRSRDAGQTWQPVNSGLKRLEVKALMAVEHELYAGTGDGVYQLHDSEDHWVPVTAGLDDILVHALARSADGTLFAGTSGKGIFRFSPRSSGWMRMHHGLKDHEGMIENFIRVLVIDQDQSIFAGTFDGGVFRSTDGGLTWRSISRALPNDSIRGIVVNDRALVVATGNGIFKTVDKGKQWIAMNKGLTNLAVQVLIGFGDKELYAGTSSGVFRSDDGVSWIAVNQGLETGIAPPPFLFR
jgi:ligand-binding sensor domain-containing protein